MSVNELETHAVGQFQYAVVVYHEEVLGTSVCLERLHTQMLTHVVLSALAGVALAAYGLRACRDVVARPAYRHLIASSNYNAGILMSLHYGIERGRMQSVVYLLR